jgi:hypothetical protein
VRMMSAFDCDSNRVEGQPAQSDLANRMKTKCMKEAIPFFAGCIPTKTWLSISIFTAQQRQLMVTESQLLAGMNVARCEQRDPRMRVSAHSDGMHIQVWSATVVDKAAYIANMSGIKASGDGAAVGEMLLENKNVVVIALEITSVARCLVLFRCSAYSIFKAYSYPCIFANKPAVFNSFQRKNTCVTSLKCVSRPNFAEDPLT